MRPAISYVIIFEVPHFHSQYLLRHPFVCMLFTTCSILFPKLSMIHRSSPQLISLHFVPFIYSSLISHFYMIQKNYDHKVYPDGGEFYRMIDDYI